MRILILVSFLVTSLFCTAQSLPFTFESDITTGDFTDFDGGTATVISNPQVSGINTSATVAQIIRNGGTIWSGSKVQLSQNLDLSNEGVFSMKLFTTAPAGIIMKLKLEGDGAPVEINVPTTTSGEWEELSWDFTGLPGNYNNIVFMFNYGVVGDGSMSSTFLFDDVTQGSSTDVQGCTYPEACNYNASATSDDGSCDYSCIGCMDILALNYDSDATIQDDSCVYAPEDNCKGDFTGDGFVNVSDLGGFLGAFGDACD